jgi:hypothetical protein
MTNSQFKKLIDTLESISSQISICDSFDEIKEIRKDVAELKEAVIVALKKNGKKISAKKRSQ